MRSRACKVCGAELPPAKPGPGRPPEYCSDPCRREGVRVNERRWRSEARAAVRFVRAMAKEAPAELEPWRTEHGGIL